MPGGLCKPPCYKLTSSSHFPGALFESKTKWPLMLCQPPERSNDRFMGGRTTLAIERCFFPHGYGMATGSGGWCQLANRSPQLDLRVLKGFPRERGDLDSPGFSAAFSFEWDQDKHAPGFALLIEEKQPNGSWFFPLSLSTGLLGKRKGEKKMSLLHRFLSQLFPRWDKLRPFPSAVLSNAAITACLGKQKKVYYIRFSSLLGEQRGRSEVIQRIKNRELKQNRKQKGYETVRRKKENV